MLLLIMVILYFRFPALMRKKVKTFKKINNIPATENIIKNIFSNAGIKIDVTTDLIKLENHMKIGNYYQICMLYYKTFYLKLYNESFFKKYRMKYRSFTEMSKLIYILKYRCNFNEEFVSINIYKKFLKKNFKNII